MITILFASIATLAIGLGLITGILLRKIKVIEDDYKGYWDIVYNKMTESFKINTKYYDAKLLELKEEFNRNSPKEVSHLIEKSLTELKKEMMIMASYSLMNGEPFLVPRCVVKAHEKGYLKEGFEFELGGIIYKFCNIQSANDRELIIWVSTISEAAFGKGTHVPITIYKDGLWLQLKPAEKDKDKN